MHLLPELRIYTSALVGFLIFFGLEHMVGRSRREQATEEGAEEGHELAAA